MYEILAKRERCFGMRIILGATAPNVKRLMEYLPIVALGLAGLGALVQFWASQQAEAKNSRTQQELIEAQKKLLKFNEDLNATREARKALIGQELRILHRRICQELNGAIDPLVEDTISRSRQMIDQSLLRYSSGEVFDLLVTQLDKVEPAHWKNVGNMLDNGLGEAFSYIEPFFPEMPPEEVKSIVRALKFRARELELPVRISRTLSAEAIEASEARRIQSQISRQYHLCAQHFREFAPEYLNPTDPLLASVDTVKVGR
jgi:hypothetical protein